MRKLSRFLQIPLADKVLLFEATALTAGVWIALNLFRFQTVQTALARLGKPVSATVLDTDTPDIQRTIWAVNLASHYLLRERPCLTRALVARMLLSRKGYHTILRIGVAPRASTRSIQAHAWLERNGEVVVGNLYDLGRFIPLPPLEITSKKLKAS